MSVRFCSFQCGKACCNLSRYRLFLWRTVAEGHAVPDELIAWIAFLAHFEPTINQPYYLAERLVIKRLLEEECRTRTYLESQLENMRLFERHALATGCGDAVFTLACDAQECETLDCVERMDALNARDTTLQGKLRDSDFFQKHVNSFVIHPLSIENVGTLSNYLLLRLWHQRLYNRVASPTHKDLPGGVELHMDMRDETRQLILQLLAPFLKKPSAVAELERGLKVPAILWMDGPGWRPVWCLMIAPMAVFIKYTEHYNTDCFGVFFSGFSACVPATTIDGVVQAIRAKGIRIPDIPHTKRKRDDTDYI